MLPDTTKDEIRISVAFTGYRPQKLPFGDNWDHPDAKKLRAVLYNEYDRLIRKGFRFFLTGGALGSDMMTAEVILELKKKYSKLPIYHELCLPCYGHSSKWECRDIERLERIKKQSVVTYVTDGPYCSGCMQKRNEYMVDTSAVLVAVYDGQNGGTRNTVEYAKSRRKKTVIIRPRGFIRVELFQKPEDVDQLMLAEFDDYDDGVEAVSTKRSDKSNLKI